jgi:hypothetical protein
MSRVLLRGVVSAVDGDGGDIILGTPFLRAFYTVFDAATAHVGFAATRALGIVPSAYARGPPTPPSKAVWAGLIGGLGLTIVAIGLYIVVRDRIREKRAAAARAEGLTAALMRGSGVMGSFAEEGWGEEGGGGGGGRGGASFSGYGAAPRGSMGGGGGAYFDLPAGPMKGSLNASAPSAFAPRAPAAAAAAGTAAPPAFASYLRDSRDSLRREGSLREGEDPAPAVEDAPPLAAAQQAAQAQPASPRDRRAGTGTGAGTGSASPSTPRPLSARLAAAPSAGGGGGGEEGSGSSPYALVRGEGRGLRTTVGALTGSSAASYFDVQ